MIFYSSLLYRENDRIRYAKSLHSPSTEARTILLYINMRKALMLYSGFDDLFKFLEIFCICLLRKSTSCMFCKCNWIKWAYEVAFWSGLGHSPYRSCRRWLPCRESVVLVVEHDIGDIEIAATCMDKMPHADTISITITTNSNNCKWWINHLDSCRKWECTTMERLCCIPIDILRSFSRASNSWNYYSLMWWDTEFFEGVFDCHDDEEVPTTGTPLDVCKTWAHNF